MNSEINDRPKKVRKIILLWVIMIAGVIGLIVVRYVNIVRDITTVDDRVRREYSVIVPQSSSYYDIDNLSEQNIGLQDNTTFSEKVEEELNKKLSFIPQYESSPTALIQKLFNQSLLAIVLESAYLDTLEEDQKNLFDNLRVIYTFTIAYEVEEVQTTTKTPDEPFIIYASGSDSRGSLAEIGRSDMNMLIVVNPKTYRVLLVSVPRDYYVQLHGTTGLRDKLTHAGIYGIETSKNTVGNLFGVKVDYTVKIGFSGVRKLVDAVGGIEVNSDTEFTAYTDKNCKFTIGKVKVNGACALAYARERYAYETGDRHRIQNQQEVLEVVIDKIITSRDFLQMIEVVNALEGELSTSFSYDEIIGMVQSQLSESPTWQIEKVTVDGSGSMQPTYSMGSQPLYVMIPDQSTVDAAKAKITEVLVDEVAEE